MTQLFSGVKKQFSVNIRLYSTNQHHRLEHHHLSVKIATGSAESLVTSSLSSQIHKIIVSNSDKCP